MLESSVNRREALRRIALGGLGAASMPVWVEQLLATAIQHADQSHQTVPAETALWKPKTLSTAQNETVTVLAELIIPRTDTPGATAAMVNQFIDAVIDDGSPAAREKFLGGLSWIDARATELFGAPFARCPPNEQTALLTLLASPDNTALADRPGVEFFGAMKSMTIMGYYTSEAAMVELGEDGMLFFADYPGCTHAEHKS